MENYEPMTYYFITDGTQLTKDDFLKLEMVAAYEASLLKQKLFIIEESKDIGKIYLSLN